MEKSSQSRSQREFHLSRGVFGFTTYPLTFPTSLYFMFIPLRMSLMQYAPSSKLELDLLVASTVFVFINGWRRRRFVNLSMGILAFLAFFVIYSFFSTYWTVARMEPNLYGYLAVASLTLMAVIYRPSEQDMKGFQIVCALTGVIVVAIMMIFSASLQAFVGQYGARASLVFGNSTEDPNDLALVLTMTVAASYGLALTERSTLIRLAMLAASFFSTYGILLTGSRGGTVGLVVVVGYLTISQSKRRWLSVLLVLIAALAISQLDASQVIFNRWSEDSALSSGSGRTYIWEIGKARFREAWFLGHGLDSFPTVFYEMGQLEFRVAHSLYLTILVENGVFGFFFFIVAILMTVFRSLSYREPHCRWTAALLLSLLVQAIFLSLLWTKAFWLGWAVALFGINHAAYSRKLSRPSQRKNLPSPNESNEPAAEAPAAAA